MIAAPVLTTQERVVLKQLWSILGMLDFRCQRARDLERQFVTCQDERCRRGLLTDLLTARTAQENAILDLRDGVYHLCLSSGAAPMIDED